MEMHVNGSGIGLYTVRKIINAHAGVVGANISDETSNTTKFWFTIPKSSILKKCPYCKFWSMRPRWSL